MTNTSLSVKKYLIFLILSSFLAACSAKRTGLDDFRALQTGDLVFLDLNCGDICDAIESVTVEQFAVDGPRLSHVGIVERFGDEIFILESWPPKGVQSTALSDFLARVSGGLNQPSGVYLGKLKPEFRSAGQSAVARIRTQIGKPYDDRFVWTPKSFYCSELVTFGFASEGTSTLGQFDPLFMPRPMYFGRPQSQALKTWADYYQNLKEEVPHQKLGVSPLGIYLEGKNRLFVKD
jgi:hypothetical protein